MDWAIAPDWQRTETLGADTATTDGTSVTSSATANTKGSWVQLVASSAFDAEALWLFVHTVTTNVESLIDVGIGAAGSEQVVVSDLLYNAGTSRQQKEVYVLPIAIPAGSRVAVRHQSKTASQALRIVAVLAAGGYVNAPPSSRLTTWGASTADSGGTEIDPGATANTKGSWVQLVASSDHPARFFFVSFGGRGNTAFTSDQRWLVDVGIGAAGSEQVVVSNLPMYIGSGTASSLPVPTVYMLPISIPAGSRIAVRAQCSLTDATDRLFDAVLYGGV